MFNGMALYRLAHSLHKRGVPMLPKILQACIFLLFNSYIPYSAKIGKGSRLGHRGIGVIINGESVIGEDVLIRAHVTIGKKERSGKAPVIGNRVEIGDGAKILGEISVGDGAVIGANAVVVHDVNPGSIVAGIPAKEIGRR